MKRYHLKPGQQKQNLHPLSAAEFSSHYLRIREKFAWAIRIFLLTSNRSQFLWRNKTGCSTSIKTNENWKLNFETSKVAIIFLPLLMKLMLPAQSNGYGIRLDWFLHKPRFHVILSATWHKISEENEDWLAMQFPLKTSLFTENELKCSLVHWQIYHLLKETQF